MHAHRRQRSPFECCDPLREFCVGRDFATMFDHGQARAAWTGYRQMMLWRPWHGGWLVFTKSSLIKVSTRPFDTEVKSPKVDAE